ncbi:MAG: FtsX-like permease family protein [Acidobacteria bacterium]|nr:MAG: FtsX-like permease family protein [Acidobacteriota bacterium]
MWQGLVAVFSRLGFAWARRRLDSETQDELDAHLALLADRYIRSGMTPPDAQDAARRQFGNFTQIREDVYQMNGIRSVDGLAQDLRYAFRQLRRSPGFSTVVVATLAVGIGGTTAVFSVLQAVLVAPLPYEQPGQLVRFYQQEPGKPDTRHYLTGTHFSSLRDRAASFESVAALDNYSETGHDLVKDGQAERLRVLRVTSEYFHALRAGLRGAGFDRNDEVGTRRVVLSDRLWRTRFGSHPSVIGSSVQLSGEPYEVVGIVPRGFEDPIAGEMDAWVPYPLARDLARVSAEENNAVSAVGRLRDGISLEQARAELAALSRSMKEQWPAARLSAVDVVPLQEDLVATARGPLHLLLVAVVLVLLVACVNVANLQLARAAARVHEFATRSALGSGAGRLVRQLLVESLVVAGLGGLTGLALAALGVKALQRLGLDAVPRLDEVAFDPLVLGFSVLITLATAVTSGVLPALRFARVSPIHALRQQSRSATGTRQQGRLLSGLAAAQLALALTLLVGAGVLLASFHRLQQVDLGFRVDGVLAFDVNLPTIRYDAARRAAFQEDLARRLRTIPGVTAAGAISFLPATGSYHGWNTSIGSGPRAGTSISRRNGFNIQQRTVSGDLFVAMEIPVLAGRIFDERDAAGTPSRAVVSANFARAAFPGPFDSAVGQRISAGGRKLEIIGVVGDVTLDVYGSPAFVVYHAHRQFADDRNWALSHVVATDVPPERILAEVRAAVAELDPELVVHRAAPMAEVVGRGARRERFALVLMAGFAGVSLLLAALGLYGVLTYAVRQRTQEIGIRMALGATAAHVHLTVLRQAGLVIGTGLLAGAGGALALGRWLTSLVFEISPSDPRILLAAAFLLTATGLFAAWLPARRASRVAPRIAIQES